MSRDEHFSSRYGENVVSWLAVWDRFYPPYADAPHDDSAAAGMQRFKGLVVAQAAEVEAALGELVARLEPQANAARRTAGNLAREARRLLSAAGANSWTNELNLIDRAVKSRNRVAHLPVRIGSSWFPYVGGGGGWEPVISFLGEEMYDEMDLREDLMLQQAATEAVVHILHSIYEGP